MSGFGKRGEPKAAVECRKLLGKADAALGWIRWRSQQRLEFLPENLQGAVVLDERLVDFRQAAKNRGVGGERLALFDESADDVDAHLNRAWTAQRVRGHYGAMLGERPRTVGAAAMTTLGTGHKL